MMIDHRRVGKEGFAGEKEEGECMLSTFGIFHGVGDFVE
jgi:hypothetical protein